MSKIKRELQSYRCTLEILSPIHIGFGQTLYPDNYIIQKENNSYYRISFADYFQKLQAKEREELTQLLEQGDTIKIRNFIHKNYKEKYGYIYKGKVSQKVLKDYIDKFSGTNKKNENKTFEIEETIKSDFRVYIPGSSIKGAIRTAFLANEFDPDKKEYFIERNSTQNTKPFQEPRIEKIKKYLPDERKAFIEKQNEITRKKLNNNKKLLAVLIGLEREEPKADPFKNLYISDTDIKNDDIRIEEVVRWSKKKGQGSGVYHELLDWERDNLYTFQILLKEFQIDKEILESLVRKKNENRGSVIRELKDIYVDEIFKNLNHHAEKMITADKNFFQTMASNKKDPIMREKGEKTLKFYEYLEKVFSDLKEKEALIRIGKGSGFHSKTLNLFTKNPQELFSVNLIDDSTRDYYLTMGWAKLSYQEEESF